MTSPRNTSKPDTADLLGLMLGGSDAIYAQEAQGQREVLQATTLPSDTRGRDAEFEALGFTFGAVVEGDRLFRETTLPDGWAKQGTDHSMHTVIVDERGIARVSVFYKAASYDRRADMSVLNVGFRFANEWIYGDEDPELNPLFTEAELADAREEAESYIERAKDHPDIYGDRVPRAEAMLKALDARAAA